MYIRGGYIQSVFFIFTFFIIFVVEFDSFGKISVKKMDFFAVLASRASGYERAVSLCQDINDLVSSWFMRSSFFINKANVNCHSVLMIHAKSNNSIMNG